MTEIKIGGRTIPLFYSTLEMVDIQNEIGCTAYQLKEEVFGLRQEDEEDPTSYVFDVVKDGEKAKKLGTLIRILGNAGLEEQGEAPDLTDKWILRHMRPGLIIGYAFAAMNEITEGNRVEAPAPAEEQGPVDVTLEEEQAKKQPGN